MRERLRTFIDNLKSDRRMGAYDEAKAKQGVILPVLSVLGWDPTNVDEVVPEYGVGDNRVDYALRLGNANKVFMEVKRPSEDLEKHQGQLLNYSFQAGVKLAALTNAETWWFYLPLHEGSWEQRKFYAVDIMEQTSEDVACKLIDILSRENVERGKAVENAEMLYRSEQKRKILRNTLPDAWNKLVSEADEPLIELLSETTEKLCGYKADAEVVEAFLVKNKARLLFGNRQAMEAPEVAERRVRRPRTVPAKGYRRKSPQAFIFGGTRYRVNFWRDVLIRLCEVLAARHKGDFDKVLSLRGRKRQYFSRTQSEINDMEAPKKLDNTDIFVEVNLSAKSVEKMCFDIISLFGYSNSDLTIEAE